MLKHWALALFVPLLILASGCAQPAQQADHTPPPQADQPANQTNLTHELPPAQNLSAADFDTKKLDKFSLWTNGTQLRGANIYQRIVYADGYDDPEAWGYGPLGPNFTQQDFDALSAAGANLVVLSHPGLYDVDPPYALNTSVQDNLDRYIGMAKKADMFVVIAFRTGPGRSEFGFFGVTEGDEFAQARLNDDVWKDAEAQDKWVGMWGYAAQRYRNESAVVGYELMVEPNSNGVWLDIYEPSEFYPAYENSTYDWNQLHPRISKAIREVDNETPILIGGMSWSAVRWLPYIKPGTDNRTLYTVHQYEPQEQYTHQDYRIEPKLNGYPGRLDLDWDDDEERFDSSWFETLLSPVNSFQAEYGASVAATEYGLKRWEPGAPRFLDDEMSAFEERGMNHAIWSWQPAAEGYNEAQNDFNFRMGPDPGNITEGGSELYDAIKRHWAKNSVRPSSFSSIS